MPSNTTLPFLIASRLKQFSHTVPLEQITLVLMPVCLSLWLIQHLLGWIPEVCKKAIKETLVSIIGYIFKIILYASIVAFLYYSIDWSHLTRLAVDAGANALWTSTTSAATRFYADITQTDFKEEL